MTQIGVVEVFTAKPIEAILEIGGSQSWVLNPDRMGHITYVVCVRNDTREYDSEFPDQRHDEPRNSAFLVGKVSGIKWVKEHNGRNRYRIEISEYAIPDAPVPNFRNGSTRNPVLYSDTDHCKFRGLDIEALTFKPMPKVGQPDAESMAPFDGQPASRGLTIPEAKAGLSVHFGVPVESIQITISG